MKYFKNEDFPLISKENWIRLKRANKLCNIKSKIFDILSEKEDNEIDHILKHLFENKNIEEIEQYLRVFPSGFNRAELRTFYNKLKKENEGEK